MAGAFLLILYCQNFQFAHNCGHMGTVFAELGLGCELREKSNKSGTLCLGVGRPAGRGLTYHAGSPGFIPQYSINQMWWHRLVIPEFRR